MTAYKQFRAVYLVLTLNFLIPGLVYMFAPAHAIRQFSLIGELTTGAAYPWASGETGEVWHILACGNVLNLALMCGLLWHDLKRFYPVLIPLVFMKGFSTLMNGIVFAFKGRFPGFLAIFLLDGTTAAAMVFFAQRARRELGF